MKKQGFLLILIALIPIPALRSQTIADTLEIACNLFSKKDYKAAAPYFDYFLSRIDGNKMDYYFAGVCQASLNEPDKSMNYLNKAASNRSEYIMMQNDPELITIRPKITEIVQRLNELDGIYKLLQNKYPRNKNLLTSIDSIYHLLPGSKVSDRKLSNIAWNYFYFNDTVQFIYYLHEAYESCSINEKKYKSENLEKEIDRLKNKVSRTTLNKLFSMDFFNFYYALSMINNIDSFRYYLSRVPYETYLKLLPSSNYYSLINYFIETKNYTPAYKLIYSGLATGRVDIKKIFKEKETSDLFKQPLGKTFLTQLLSEKVIPTIETSDKIFVANAYEYSSSKREKYNFLRNMNFSTRIPSLKKFQVQKNIYGSKTIPGKSVVVAETYPYGLYEDELNIIIDSALNVKPIEDKYTSIFDPKNELVLAKSTGIPEYAYTTGQFYRQPIENIPFIVWVKNGKVKKSIIPAVREQYFKPLIPYAIKSTFGEPLEKEDIRYYAYTYGYDMVASYIEEEMRSPQKEDLDALLLYFRFLSLNHTKGFDLMVHILENPENFLKVNEENYSEGSYHNIKRIIEDYIEDLTSENEFTSLELGESRYRSDTAEISKWKEAAGKIAMWWDNYKKTNSYTLPPIVNCNITEEKGLPKNTRKLALSASNKPIFYDPSEKEILEQEKEYEITDEVATIVVEELEAPRKTEERYISGKIIGDSGYIFIPNQRDGASDLFIIPYLTENELGRLNQVYSDLGLTKTGKSLIAGEYDMSYDKYYTFRFNKQLVIFWFTDTTLYASFLDNSEPSTISPIALCHSRQLTCSDKGSAYKEINYNLNSLQVAKIGENLLLLCNFNIKENPGCSNQKSRIYLQMLGSNLQPVNEQILPAENSESFDSNPKAQMKITNNFIYVLVQTGNSSSPLYGAVFNKKLERVVNKFGLPQNKEQTYGSKPITVLSGDGDNVYCVYSVNKLGEALMAVNKINPDGQISQPIYIYNSEGSVYDYTGYISKGNIVLYLLENSFQKDELKKLKVPIATLKFMP